MQYDLAVTESFYISTRRTSVPGHLRQVNLMVAEEISLFAREALGNAVRHSQGTH
jgi:signal transduction histidine kinase